MRCVIIKDMHEFHYVDIQFVKWVISLCGCDIYTNIIQFIDILFFLGLPNLLGILYFTDL